jgi:hypothetical protein
MRRGPLSRGGLSLALQGAKRNRTAESRPRLVTSTRREVEPLSQISGASRLTSNRDSDPTSLPLPFSLHHLHNALLIRHVQVRHFGA